jgi:hypothetical protein
VFYRLTNDHGVPIVDMETAGLKTESLRGQKEGKLAPASAGFLWVHRSPRALQQEGPIEGSNRLAAVAPPFATRGAGALRGPAAKSRRC